MARWILLNGDGTVAHQLVSAVHPCDPPEPDANPPFDWLRSRVVEVDRFGDLETERWTGAGWEPVVAAIEARLLAEVDAERFARCAPFLPAHSVLAAAYLRKSLEVRAYTAELGAHNPTDYPWLAGEAARSGLTLAEVVERVTAAIAADETAMREIDAIAVAAKMAIRAAATISAKRAAAVVDWGA